MNCRTALVMTETGNRTVSLGEALSSAVATAISGLLMSIALQFHPGQFNGLVQLGLQGFARREQGEVVGHPDVALG